jgi:pilus assembly protein CpaC
MMTIVTTSIDMRNMTMCEDFILASVRRGTRVDSGAASCARASREPGRNAKYVSLALLGLFVFVQCAVAQTPRDPLISGFQPHLPDVPAQVPPLSQRFQAASSFIESLSKNDAMFEVVIGQGRVIALKEDLVLDDGQKKKGQPLIAIGNPDILDFDVVGPRQIRLIGKQIGVTDVNIITESQQTFSYEVHVVYDLNVLQARIRELLPDARIRVAQLGKNLVVEGQARDTSQIRQITELVRRGVLTDQVSGTAQTGGVQPSSSQPPLLGGMDQGLDGDTSGPEIINLLRVPGPQQVMLKVQIAELNRTALRQIGSDLLFADGHGHILGTRLNNASTTSATSANGAGLTGLAATAVAAASPATAFAIFEGAGFQAMVTALRQNSMLKVLAEPNLVAMNGHEARFLAGGEFPVPVPQSGAGGGPATITVQYKKFGVQLNFVPYILDDGTIRLSVDPEVSSIDFSLGIELSGTKVPGLNTRNAHTVVELREGQTLAIAGLMQLTLTGDTRRIPGLGDLPYIGPFFSNTSGNRIEKELVVLVTPYIVEPMQPEEVSARPGDEVYEPNDLEFYLLGRLQGRTGDQAFRSTTIVDDPLHLMRRMKLECRAIQGPVGYSE